MWPSVLYAVSAQETRHNEHFRMGWGHLHSPSRAVHCRLGRQSMDRTSLDWPLPVLRDRWDPCQMRSRKNTLVFLRVESLVASANGSAGVIVNGIAVAIANGSMAEKDGLPLQSPEVDQMPEV